VTGRSLVRILSSDLTIDLGTANTLVYVTGKNIVVDELCIVALNKKTGTSMVPPMTPTDILEAFSLRWPLEMCFRDVKQFLGFEDPQNRVANAAQRTAPLVQGVDFKDGRDFDYRQVHEYRLVKEAS
jgi:hypothetical protein